MGQGNNGAEAQWGRGTMGRGRNGAGEQWDGGTMGRGRNGAGEQWDGGIRGHGCNGKGSYRAGQIQGRPPKSRGLGADHLQQLFDKLLLEAFSSLARFFGECSNIHSPPAPLLLLPHFFFFFLMEISSRTLIRLFRSGSGLGRVFPEELRVS